MTVEQDPAAGEQPLPNVELASGRKYPLIVERLVSLACLAASIILIPQAIGLDLGIPATLQVPLAICLLPLFGLLCARLLLFPIHAAATAGSD